MQGLQRILFHLVVEFHFQEGIRTRFFDCPSRDNPSDMWCVNASSSESCYVAASSELSIIIVCFPSWFDASQAPISC